MEGMDFLSTDALDEDCEMDPLRKVYLKQQEKLKDVEMKQQNIIAKMGLEPFECLSTGRSRVFKCQYPQSSNCEAKYFALKITSLADDYEAHEKFDKEVYMLKKFSDLSVPRLFQAMKLPDLGCATILTEFCPGGTLADVLESGGIPGQTQQARIVFRLIETIDRIHKQYIVHRNICPSNILLDSEGFPILTGFGSAVWHRPDEYLIRGVPAMRPYLAPEIVKKPFKFHDSYKADIFSLGMVLCRVLYPDEFHSSARKLLKTLATKVFPYNSIWAVFQELVRHMVSRDPEERYDSRDVQDFLFINCTRVERIIQQLDAANGIPAIFDHIHVKGFSCNKPTQTEGSSSLFTSSLQCSPPDEDHSLPYTQPWLVERWGDCSDPNSKTQD